MTVLDYNKYGKTKASRGNTVLDYDKYGVVNPVGVAGAQQGFVPSYGGVGSNSAQGGFVPNYNTGSIGAEQGYSPVLSRPSWLPTMGEMNQQHVGASSVSAGQGYAPIPTSFPDDSYNPPEEKKEYDAWGEKKWSAQNPFMGPVYDAAMPIVNPMIKMREAISAPSRLTGKTPWDIERPTGENIIQIMESIKDIDEYIDIVKKSNMSPEEKQTKIKSLEERQKNQRALISKYNAEVIGTNIEIRKNTDGNKNIELSENRRVMEEPEYYWKKTGGIFTAGLYDQAEKAAGVLKRDKVQEQIDDLKGKVVSEKDTVKQEKYKKILSRLESENPEQNVNGWEAAMSPFAAIADRDHPHWSAMDENKSYADVIGNVVGNVEAPQWIKDVATANAVIGAEGLEMATDPKTWALMGLSKAAPKGLQGDVNSIGKPPVIGGGGGDLPKNFKIPSETGNLKNGFKGVEGDTAKLPTNKKQSFNIRDAGDTAKLSESKGNTPTEANTEIKNKPVNPKNKTNIADDDTFVITAQEEAKPEINHTPDTVVVKTQKGNFTIRKAETKKPGVNKPEKVYSVTPDNIKGLTDLVSSLASKNIPFRQENGVIHIDDPIAQKSFDDHIVSIGGVIHDTKNDTQTIEGTSSQEGQVPGIHGTIPGDNGQIPEVSGDKGAIPGSGIPGGESNEVVEQIAGSKLPGKTAWKLSNGDIELRDVPVGVLHVDPQRFQYRKTVNGKGVELDREVPKWDENKAGTVFVFHDPKDGKLYVVNGHHRVAWANKQGIKTIPKVQVLSTQDAKEAKSFGAELNIAEGAGKLFDVATYLRSKGITDFPQLDGMGLNNKTAVAGIHLANLNDGLFRKYEQTMIRGKADDGSVLPENVAVEIGKHLNNPDDQNLLYEKYQKSRLSAADIADYAAEIKRAASSTEYQLDLFGETETTKSLVDEQIKLKKAVRNYYSQDVRDFGGSIASEERAKKLTGTGQLIDVEGNKERVKSAKRIVDIFDTLYDGELYDKFKGAAVRLDKGENFDTLVKELQDEVEKAVKKHFGGKDGKSDKRTESGRTDTGTEEVGNGTGEGTDSEAETGRSGEGDEGETGKDEVDKSQNEDENNGGKGDINLSYTNDQIYTDIFENDKRFILNNGWRLEKRTDKGQEFLIVTGDEDDKIKEKDSYPYGVDYADNQLIIPKITAEIFIKNIRKQYRLIKVEKISRKTEDKKPVVNTDKKNETDDKYSGYFGEIQEAIDDLERDGEGEKVGVTWIQKRFKVGYVEAAKIWKVFKEDTGYEPEDDTEDVADVDKSEDTEDKSDKTVEADVDDDFGLYGYSPEEIEGYKEYKFESLTTEHDKEEEIKKALRNENIRKFIQDKIDEDAEDILKKEIGLALHGSTNNHLPLITKDYLKLWIYRELQSTIEFAFEIESYGFDAEEIEEIDKLSLLGVVDEQEIVYKMNEEFGDISFSQTIYDEFYSELLDKYADILYKKWVHLNDEVLKDESDKSDKDDKDESDKDKIEPGDKVSWVNKLGVKKYGYVDHETITLAKEPGYVVIEDKTRTISIVYAKKITLVEKAKKESKPETKRDPLKVIADYVTLQLATGQFPDTKEITEEAKKPYAFGTSLSEGKYNEKHLYDAVEMGINQYILLHVKPALDAGGEEARKIMEQLDELDRKIKVVQSKRTEKQQKLQQFSTPSPYSYLVAWLANIGKTDTVLEPSAGTGSLAIYGRLAGAMTIVNEIDTEERDGRKLGRNHMLKLMGFNTIHNFDGEQINNLLPDDDRPTVVLANPPFSSSGDRGIKSSQNGFRHITQALKTLQDGGRLVAILGESAEWGSNVAKDFWKETRANYTVRAVVKIDGKVYDRRGTSYPTVLIIIDNIKPAEQTTPLTGSFKTLAEAAEKLEGIKNGRKQISESKQTPSKPTGSSDAEEDGSGDSPDGNTQPPTDTGSVPGSGGGKSGDRGSGSSSSKASGSGSRGGNGSSSRSRGKGGSSALSTDKSEGSDTGDDGGSSSGGDRGDKIVSGVGERGEIQLEESEEENRVTEKTFDGYVPTAKFTGGKEHPGELVESAVMRSVPLPDLTVMPNIPQEMIENGVFSLPQLEAIAYAEQAHSETLPDGTRKGFFIGDGTGVGKGREIAGIILSNWNAGRRKAIWVSQNKELFKDASRDLVDIGFDTKNLFLLEGKKKLPDEGVMFVSYDTLKAGLEDPARINPKSRLAQILAWLPEDWDGVIMYDEAHNMANSGSEKKKASQKALAGIKLANQRRNARVVYVSATGATEVENLAYAERLGLWGTGTIFPTRSNFMGQIMSGGIASMEVLARDMKAMGLYMARGLDYSKCSFRSLEHKLTKEEREMYDTSARAWQMVMREVNNFIKQNDTGKQEINKIKGQFAGRSQQFFNQMITAFQTPEMMKDIKKQLANGKTAVIQITNTNEAQQDRKEDKRRKGEIEDEDFDLTVKDILIDFVRTYFPVVQYQKVRNAEGKVEKQPVVLRLNADGSPVYLENKEAVRKRDALIRELAVMQLPPNPIDAIRMVFGDDNVAEITGRKKRYDYDQDGNLIYVTDKNGDEVYDQNGLRAPQFQDRKDATREAEIKDFIDDKRKILIFSEKGGTGASYHASNTFKNKRQRIHYVLQAGWRADKCIQGFGRTNRTNQANYPEYVLVQTDVQGQKRFLATIARRLEQMGALTKGERTSGGQGLFDSRTNLFSEESRDAFLSMWGSIEKIIPDAVNKMNLKKDDRGQLQEFIGIEKLLNRVLNLELKDQERFFEIYNELRNRNEEQAKKNGTFDTGLETIRADKIEVTNDQVVWKKDGVETRLLTLKCFYKSRKIGDIEELPETLTNTFRRNKRSGKIYGFSKVLTRTNPETNRVESYYNTISPSGKRSYIDIRPNEDEYWDKLTLKEARKAWVEEHDELPDYDERKVYLLTGALLPIWNRIPGKTMLRRAKTDKGSFLGCLIDEKHYDNLAMSFGLSGEERTPADVYRDIMDNKPVTLINGWRLTKSKARNIATSDKKARIKIESGSYFSETEPINETLIKSIVPNIEIEVVNYFNTYLIPIDENTEKNITSLLNYKPERRVKREVALRASLFGLDVLAKGIWKAGSWLAQNTIGKIVDWLKLLDRKWTYAMIDDLPELHRDLYHWFRDTLLGERNRAYIETSLIVQDFQEKIRKLTGEKTWGDKSTKLDQLIHLWIDVKNDPFAQDLRNELKQQKLKLPEEKIRLVEEALNLSPEEKALAKEISDYYDFLGQKAVSGGIINNLIDDYVARVWDLKGKKGQESFARFTAKTRHAKKRKMVSIVDGWLEGLELKVKGATNNLLIYGVEIGNTLADHKFFHALVRAQLVSVRRGNGYDYKINHPAFSRWAWVGKAQDVKGLYSKRLYATAPDPDDNQWQEIFEERELYTTKEIAHNLNNMFGVSIFNQGWTGELAKINSALKSLILSFSFFHHFAYARSFFFGGCIQNPFKAYKEGLKSLRAMEPDIKQLIDNGMTVFLSQDFDENVYDRINLMEEIMKKARVPEKTRNKILGAYQSFLNFLFNDWGSGLKVHYALHKLQDIRKKYPNLSPKKQAEWVAGLVNDDFGGLNLKKLGRNPNWQWIMRIFFLASDWTESNFRMFIRQFTGAGGYDYDLKKMDLALREGILPLKFAGEDGFGRKAGDADFGLHREKKSRKLYSGRVGGGSGGGGGNNNNNYSEKELGEMERRFIRGIWAKIAALAAMTTFAANLIIHRENVGKAYWRSVSTDGVFDWKKFAKFYWMKVDVTPIYDVAYGKDMEGKQKYWNAMGHFMDTVKTVTDPLNTLKNKSSVVVRPVWDMSTGEDYAGRRFSSVDELVKDQTLTNYKGGKDRKGWIHPTEVPAFVLYEGKQLFPIPVQVAGNMALGVWDGLSSLMESTQDKNAATRVVKAQDKKKKEEKAKFHFAEGVQQLLGQHVSTNYEKAKKQIREKDILDELKDLDMELNF